MTISSVGSPYTARQDSPAKIEKAAKDFEAMLINQMLQSARQATSEDEDQQDSAILDLGQQQFAQSLANSGGLGIAKMVVAGLTKHADR